MLVRQMQGGGAAAEERRVTFVLPISVVGIVIPSPQDTCTGPKVTKQTGREREREMQQEKEDYQFDYQHTQLPLHHLFQNWLYTDTRLHTVLVKYRNCSRKRVSVQAADVGKIKKKKKTSGAEVWTTNRRPEYIPSHLIHVIKHVIYSTDFSTP